MKYSTDTLILIISILVIFILVSMIFGCISYKESFKNKENKTENKIVEMLQNGSSDNQILEFMKQNKKNITKETFDNILDKVKKLKSK
jgi:flagellar basal body-associated protein FliL